MTIVDFIDGDTFTLRQQDFGSLRHGLAAANFGQPVEVVPIRPARFREWISGFDQEN
ncbi:hypothetical protein [Nocardia sp. NPDC056100]|uniref:hypothetical protein n=1 Tax=Nocardia sp. NPDC056100 TaxID=3345712 RepID=UPI0035D90DE9